ncbi:MAG: aldose epimerase family protein [Pseudomonadota bacterium]
MTGLFGYTAGGVPIHAFELSSGALSATILNLGAILQDVRLSGVAHPLTLGTSDIAAYEGSMFSFGSLMGPVVNRIPGARAEIAGREYKFEPQTEAGHTLHMGQHGLHVKAWDVLEEGGSTLRLGLSLTDGEAGLPGNRRVEAIYQLDGATLSLEISATSDAPTLFSLANHSYWNLDGSETYRRHRLRIAADHILPAGPDLIPTGALEPAAGTAYDLREGARLTADATQFFDTNFCLSEADAPLRPVAWLTGSSGVAMEIATTAPGLQVYDGGTIEDAGHKLTSGTTCAPYAGIALEAQNWPGATRHGHFPSMIYGPDRAFRQQTTWSFSHA